MASDASVPSNLAESGITITSDSENYDGNNELSPSPPSSSSSPLILYKPPTIWGLLRGAAINLVLPFINGLMLGFGELVANEAAFRLGWSGTKIFPTHRSDSRRVGPGVEMRADPVERRRRNGQELDMYTSLE
ncbi:outer membrane protein Tom13 [Pyrenochaeta sp. MPI-SDFR-AT-0127]|nr:outer membrane protein Tom13 [Pyrenochaeta sp. MPI-SDFR-AT-0127]